MGFARSAEQVAALMKQKKITLDDINKEILEDTTLAYANLPKEKRFIPSGKRSPFMFVGQNPVMPTDENVQKAKDRGKPLEFFEVSENLDKNNLGQILNKCCEYLGLTREDVYVTNAVKYPTPDNNEPLAIDAKSHMKKFLFKEIYVVKPEIIYILGNTTASWFEKTFDVEIKEDPQKLVLNLKIENDRIEYECWVQKIYHPSYIVRNGNDFSLYEPQLNKSKKIVEELVLDWKFVHLHAHNSFSMKDGIGDPGTRIKWAVENRKNALATSNHGNIFDWLQIYNKCRAEKIKPILGAELYFNRNAKLLEEALKDDSTENKGIRKELRKKTSHVTVFAKNVEGYFNLIKINNDAWVNRFYRNPISSPEKIEECSKGVICLSGCSGSEANKIISTKFALLSENRKNEIEVLVQDKLNLIRSAFRAESLEKVIDEDNLGDYEVQYFEENQHEKLNEDDFINKAREFYINEDKEEIKNADEKARNIIKWWHSVFKDDFYIEIMVIDYAPQILINIELIKIAKELNIPLVITNDVHYVERGASKVQQLQMLNDQNKTWADLAADEKDEIWTIKGEEFYFKTVQELKEAWEKWHKSDIFTEEIFWEGIKNTIAISDKVENFTIDKSNKLPQMSENSKKVLAAKIKEGLIHRGLKDKKEYLDRTAFEYEIICKKGFADYFLIISDIIQYSKNKWGQNSVGCGRGSAAGSLVNYLIGNTDVDPLKHNLLFERFMDIARADAVDIDCLHELTAIKMYSGEIKQLKDVKVGDIILDHFNNPQKILNWTTRTAKIEYEKIVEVVIKNGTELGSFICPEHHRMINSENEVKFVYDLNVGDKIKSFGKEEAIIIQINVIDIDYSKIKLVDIQVENTETFQIYPFKVNENFTCLNNIFF